LYKCEIENISSNILLSDLSRALRNTFHSQSIYIETMSKYQSYLSKLHADKSVTDSIANLADKAQTEQRLYEQSLLTSSQYSKFIEAYDLATILLIIGAGLGSISEIAKNKLLGYPSLVVGGFGVIVLLLISFMPAIL
jgi:hypothetical protein